MEEIMTKETEKTIGRYASSFEQIKCAKVDGLEFWSSCEYPGVLGYVDYHLENHLVDVTELVAFERSMVRPVKSNNRTKRIGDLHENQN
jgi:hypothetical protein